MAEGWSDEINENIICELCSETYRQPKLLPCFHTFCLSCLDTYVKETGKDDGAFECPLCKTKIDIPEDGVNDLQSNIYLPGSEKYFMYGNEVRHCCDLCGPNVTATNHCTICEENYCERCSEMHLKQRATRTHALMPLSDSTSGPKIPLKKRHFCRKHPNDELRVVCKDCNDELLCIICKLTDHEKHKSREIEDEAKTAKEAVIRNVQKDDKTIHELNKILDNIKHADNETEKQKDSYLESLDRLEEKLRETIKQKKTRLGRK